MKVKPKVIPYWEVNRIEEIRSIGDISGEFEKIFLRFLLKEMEKTVPEGLFNSSFQSKMYLDLFGMQLVDSISSSGKLGLRSFFEEAIKSYLKNTR